MSQLNKKSTHVVTKSLSANGNLQKDKSDKQMLYDILSMTLLGKDNYYSTTSQLITKMDGHMSSLVKADKVSYIANLAIHARVNMNIRSIPIVMVVHLGKHLHDNNATYSDMRKLVCSVIQRADELTDMFSYALSYYGSKNKIPTAIKMGVADATLKFNEYHYGKYSGKGKSLTMKKLFQIVHPKGRTKEQLSLFKAVNDEMVKTPYTWETQLSEAGKIGKSKKTVWEELIDSNKLGIMAQIRNLRNMVEADVSSGHLTKICDNLDNRETIVKSKQLPYRFLSALNATSELHNTKINRAISRAVDHSLHNVPHLGDDVWVIVDCSLSMNSDRFGSSGDGISPFQKASLFASALAKKNGDSDNFRLTMFSDNAKHISYNPDSPILDIFHRMQDEMYGGGTNLDAALDMRNDLGFTPKVIIIFSDMEVNYLHGSNIKYLNNNDMIKIAVNVAPTSNTPVHDIQGWLQVSGYSDSIFDYIQTTRSSGDITSKLSKSLLSVDDIRNL